MLQLNDPFLTMAQNGPVVCNINRGNKTLALQLQGAGTAFDFATMVNRIQIKLNKKTVIDLTMAELRAINAELGITDSATIQNIDFQEIAALNVGTLYTGGYDTAAGVTSFQIILTMVGAPADASVELYRDDVPPELSAAGQPVGIGMIMAFVKTTIPIGSASTHSHEPNKGREYPDRVKRLFVLGSNVTAVGVKKNGLYVHEDIPAAINSNDAAKWGRVPQADQYCVDMVKRGDGTEAIFKGSASSLLYRVQTNAAGDVTLIEQLITTLDLL